MSQFPDVNLWQSGIEPEPAERGGRWLNELICDAADAAGMPEDTYRLRI